MSVINNCHRFYRGLIGIGCCVLIASLAACQQYEDRSDKITLQLGDAVESNKVIHTINPWPPGVHNKAIAMDGARALAANKRYENNKIIKPKRLRTNSK